MANLKNLPPSDVADAIKKIMADSIADEALCLGYANGLYEGWKEGHEHGVMASHLHAAVPPDWKPVLKSMSDKELNAIDTELKTDVPCVPDHVTFGDLRDVVVKYFRGQVEKNPLLNIVPTSRLFPYSLLAAFLVQPHGLHEHVLRFPWRHRKHCLNRF